MAGLDVSVDDWISRIFDRLAWVARYSKGAVTLRDALGLATHERLDARSLSAFEAALVRLIEREQAETKTEES